jgi:hypothetical protein
VILCALGCAPAAESELADQSEAAIGGAQDSLAAPGPLEPVADIMLDEVWVSPSYDERKYSELMIAPVDTRQIAQLRQLQDANPVAFDQSHGGLQAAAYAQQSIARSAAADPARRFSIVERVGAKTLIVEMAITGLAPNRTGIAITGLAGTPVGAPAPVAQTNFPDRGGIAMQTQVRDGATGEVMLVITDARANEPAATGPARFKPYGFTDRIIDQWTRAVLKAIANPPLPQTASQ